VSDEQISPALNDDELLNGAVQSTAGENCCTESRHLAPENDDAENDEFGDFVLVDANADDFKTSDGMLPRRQITDKGIKQKSCTVS
jgi:hypothetical protein